MIKKKIVIITGGTGGHVIPSITLYKSLIKLNWDVYWIIDLKSVNFLLYENIFMDKINIIDIYNFSNLNIFKKIFYFFTLIKLIFHSILIFNKIKPDISLGMGSYVIFPSCISSWIKNVPIILHEQNYVIGLCNKILSIISKKILQGFYNKNYKNKNIIFTGNPIRDNILNINHLSNVIKKRKGLIRILILGGSQGSNFINNLFLKIVSKLSIKFIIWHQVGYNNYKYIYTKYSDLFLLKKIYKLEEYIIDIHKAYLWSDLLIGRSGAITVSEVLYIGLPSIFVPFIHKNNHQYL